MTGLLEEASRGLTIEPDHERSHSTTQSSEALSVKVNSIALEYIKLAIFEYFWLLFYKHT